MRATAQEPEYYVASPLLWPILLGLRVLDVDVDSLLREVGLSLEQVRDPDTRVRAEQVSAIVRGAVKAAGDENIGLRLSLLYEPGAFGVLDHLARSSRTLREAIEVLCRYERIHQNVMTTTLGVKGKRAMIDHRRLPPYPPPRQVSENTLANLVVIGRKWTGLDFTPIEVRIAHPPPANVSLHTRLFRCPIRWSAPSDMLVLPASLLDAPLLMANAGLSQALDRHAVELLKRLSSPMTFSRRVRECICAMLPRGDASLEGVAGELGVGARTLQRRLSDEGTSHELLLEELRRHLGAKYLRQPHVSIEDAALLLGFSDSRAFRRAFKRWTGFTPSRFRRDTAADGSIAAGVLGATLRVTGRTLENRSSANRSRR